MFPGKLREVNQPVHTLNVDKGAKISQAADVAGDPIPHFQILDELFLDRLPGFPDGVPFREDQALAGAVHFNDFQGDGFSYRLLPALLRGFAFLLPENADQRAGHKSAQFSYGDQQPPFVKSFHHGVQGFPALQHLLHPLPIFFLFGACVGEDDVSVGILRLNHVDGNFFPDLKCSQGFLIDLVQFVPRDDPIRFGLHVNQDLVGHDRGDLPLADLPFLRNGRQTQPFLSQKGFHIQRFFSRGIPLWRHEFIPILCFLLFHKLLFSLRLK